MFEKDYIGKKNMEEETIYDDEGRESLLNNDEIDPEEQAFMKGYEEADVCSMCKKPLIESDRVIEKEVKGEIFKVCSDECLQKIKKEFFAP